MTSFRSWLRISGLRGLNMIWVYITRHAAQTGHLRMNNAATAQVQMAPGLMVLDLNVEYAEIQL